MRAWIEAAFHPDSPRLIELYSNLINQTFFVFILSFIRLIKMLALQKKESARITKHDFANIWLSDCF